MNDSLEQGWFDPRTGESGKIGQKPKLWNRIKVFFGYDIRKDQWIIVDKGSCRKWHEDCNGHRVYWDAVLILYRNGLGVEKAQLQYSQDIENVPVEWAKEYLKRIHNG
jgi:hypothetical protein